MSHYKRRISFCFEHKFSETEFRDKTGRSPTVVMSCVPWSFHLADDDLFHLECKKRIYFNASWFMKVICDFCLRDRDGRYDPLCFSKGSVFSSEGQEGTYWSNPQWPQSIHNYIINGKITVQCEIRIEEHRGVVLDLDDGAPVRDFSKRIDHLTDTILRVDETDFHVSKTVLSTFCEYFQGVFRNRFLESSQEIIELDDFDPEVFQVFLDVLHHENRITERNVEILIPLISYFGAECLMKECLKVLISASEEVVSNDKKLVLADRYSLNVLTEHCLRMAAEAEERSRTQPRVIDERQGFFVSIISAIIEFLDRFLL